MKLLLIPILSSIGIVSVNNLFDNPEKQNASLSRSHSVNSNKENNTLNFQHGAGFTKMSAVEFKNQDYCRAELENFEFDAHYTVVSATVYFSGANFRNTEKGFIISSNLKPIKQFMSRCIPGSMVLFDEIKVKGPDNKITSIQGLQLSLF